MSFLAADVVVQGEGAPAVKGIDAARPIWASFFQIPYTELVDVEPRTIFVSAAGDLAYDVGNWKLLVPSNSATTEERGKSTIIWKRFGGEWKAVAISFSMDAAPH